MQMYVRFVITVVGALLTPGMLYAAEPLVSVVVQNSSVYGAPELFSVYRQQLGKPVTGTTALSIAESLQQKYVDDGYSRPGFTIHDPGTTTGIARIRVVEAKISKVEITGNAGPHRQRLESLVAGLDSDSSLRPNDVRDALRRARRLPGLEVNIATEPDDAGQGSYLLAVDSAFKPLEGSVTVSNRGTHDIGRNLATARVVYNGLLGSENASGIFVTTAGNSDDYRGGGLFSSHAIGDRGTSLQVQAAVTSLDIESQGTPLQQRRERYLLKFSRPLHEWHDSRLVFTGGLEIENVDLARDSSPSREDRLRSLESGVAFGWRAGTRQQLLGLDIEQGLNGFGSRIDNFLSPEIGQDTDFTIARLKYVHLVPINDSWALRWDSVGQHSPDVLPSIKRFKIGGGRIGRGFEAAAASGDRGVAAKIEMRRRMADTLSWLQRADLYSYFDLGTAWRNDEPDRASASSTGLGISVSATRVSGYFEIAKPLTHADVDGRDDTGIFAELTWKF